MTALCLEEIGNAVTAAMPLRNCRLSREERRTSCAVIATRKGAEGAVIGGMESAPCTRAIGSAVIAETRLQNSRSSRARRGISNASIVLKRREHKERKDGSEQQSKFTHTYLRPELSVREFKSRIPRQRRGMCALGCLLYCKTPAQT